MKIGAPLLAAGELEPALGAGELFQRGEDARRLAAGGDGEAGGDRGVLHLEGADQRQLDFVGRAGMGERDDLREAVDRAADELDVVALHADGHDLEAARLRRLDHLAGIAIVDVDHRRAARRDQVGEQPQLGGEIGFDGRVIIEMVARQIGEGAGGDAHAVEPVLVEAVRGGFQRQMGDALAGKLVERAVQFDRIGRGQRAVGLALAARPRRWCRCSRPAGRAPPRSAA